MRIVTLLPGATEMVAALGLEHRLVGISHECDYPESIGGLPRLTRSTLDARPHDGETAAAAIERAVGESVRSGRPLYVVDEELLAKLAPELIITQGLCSVCAVSGDSVERFAERLPSVPRVLSMEPRSLEDVYREILRLGAVTEREKEAEQLVVSLQGRIAALASRYRSTSPPRTLVLEWTDPPYGAGHWTPSLVELAGGESVVGFPGEDSRIVAWETILAAQPEVVIVAPCGFTLEQTNAAIVELEATNAAWRVLQSQARIVPIDGNAFANRPGPRLIATAELFAAAMHQDRGM